MKTLAAVPPKPVVKAAQWMGLSWQSKCGEMRDKEVAAGIPPTNTVALGVATIAPPLVFIDPRTCIAGMRIFMPVVTYHLRYFSGKSSRCLCKARSVKLDAVIPVSISLTISQIRTHSYKCSAYPSFSTRTGSISRVDMMNILVSRNNEIMRKQPFIVVHEHGYFWIGTRFYLFYFLTKNNPSLIVVFAFFFENTKTTTNARVLMTPIQFRSPNTGNPPRTREGTSEGTSYPCSEAHT